MNLIQLKNATILFGQPPLLDAAEFTLADKERVCVVGRNGSGKSTMLKVLNGDVKLDDGQRIVASHINIALLDQDPPINNDVVLFDYVAEGLSDDAKLIKAYFAQSNKVATDHSESALKELQSIQEKLDASNGWLLEQKISNVLTQLGLDGSANLKNLSGGWRRKAALARALVSQPDILLLDEPTNHLDIDMVAWLEKSLLTYNGSIVFISHDRAFIRSMATRIIDIDRGQVKSYPGNYAKYLEQKAHDLEVQETHNKEFDKKLAKEEVWIRQGIKARRTRNEGRVRALKALREEYKSRRNQMGTAVIHSLSGAKSGKRIFELNQASYAFDTKKIIENLDLLVTRGDKVALIGPNGCGKTTLIKLLLGELQPQSGEYFTGTNIELAYFDQHRSQLDLNKPLIDAIADGKREVEVNGGTRHVISYLQDYLFSPERINAPVSTLSGGEKNRLMLAKLMLKPSNLLILDEPTNDLDVETLELLESILVEYSGTVLLVSHDREFIDNVVTSSLFFEGQGKVSQFVGGYSEMKVWHDKHSQKSLNVKENEVKPKSKQSATKVKPKKLSYKELRELESLPAILENLEHEIEKLQKQISEPDFFSQDTKYTKETLSQLQSFENKLDEAFGRWEALESKQNN
ncbi:ATP-binding cassette ATPase Uup [Glaciecola petra]|uniref:ATP-binding protein Uup n=1 Tax=Glaciecola petra TaxID=3075602 RepID=A0ABU2ZNM9_9ALTE|nr:ATP-binding cassette domain-containing protein [Aestuariibacter sp. P117]MDT0594224.1 ATP-binding cassette domain-containing protein [Aestuariibacter sp. P117]